jgi:hypothetical protein
MIWKGRTRPDEARQTGPGGAGRDKTRCDKVRHDRTRQARRDQIAHDQVWSGEMDETGFGEMRRGRRGEAGLSVMSEAERVESGPGWTWQTGLDMPRPAAVRRDLTRLGRRGELDETGQGAAGPDAAA